MSKRHARLSLFVLCFSGAGQGGFPGSHLAGTLPSTALDVRASVSKSLTGWTLWTQRTQWAQKASSPWWSRHFVHTVHNLRGH